MNYQICLFPGQGSQQSGMGADLFPLFPEYVEMANSILGYDLVDLCLNDPENRLRQTEFTQAAIFVLNTLSYLKHVQENGVPDVVLGHSLGESNALLAAGVFDFETGLRIVKSRGEAMARIEGGGMAAVIGLELDEVSEIVSARFPDLDIANINSRNQIVISGPQKTIEGAAPVFEDAFATYIPLNVSGPFHSRYMQPAQNVFEQWLSPLSFNQPQIEVIANVTGRPYDEHTFPKHFIAQITSPVRWRDSINYLLKKGTCTFFELGPGRVLSNLVSKIERDFAAS